MILSYGGGDKKLAPLGAKIVCGNIDYKINSKHLNLCRLFSQFNLLWALFDSWVSQQYTTWPQVK